MMCRLSMVTLSIIALAAIAGLLAPVATAQEADASAVFVEFVEAVNAGDVDAGLALFTEDATWLRGGRCPPGACTGQAAIRAELEKDVADHHDLDIINVHVTGNTLTARVELRTDATRAVGIERAIQIFTLEFEGGKISALQARPDITDSETADLRSRMLPATGGGPASSTDPALPLAAGLFLVGGLLVAGAFQMRPLGRKRGTRNLTEKAG